jgi:uncharacterized protein YkwD
MRGLLNWLSRIFSPTPGPAPEPAPSPSPSPTPSSEALIAALNAERTRFQLPTLQVDGRLNGIATGWAETMARNSRLDHGDFRGRMGTIYPNLAGAENIAMGRDIEQVMAMWMGSPRHRANTLGRYNLAGAGFAKSNTGAIYWCIDFVDKV